MFQFFILLMIIFLSILFMKMNHPLTMGLILMTQTLLIALFSGTMSVNFWFSYSLFLIFMGGMLILFMYMTSLSSNEIFKFSFNWKLSMVTMIIFIFIISIFVFFNFKNYLFFNKIKTLETNSIYLMKTTINFENIILNKMFNFPMNMISIMLMNYLFLTLIASVKITNIFKGPLRPTN